MFWEKSKPALVLIVACCTCYNVHLCKFPDFLWFHSCVSCFACFSNMYASHLESVIHIFLAFLTHAGKTDGLLILRFF